MKRLLLVYPGSFSTSYVDMKFVQDLTHRGGFMNVSLPTIAALTPAEFEIDIVDDSVERIDFDESYDLVGITGSINQLPRAEQIAEQFRQRGTLVVCGGPCLSLNPDRWKSFSDVIIIGEAERIWPEFIGDYLAGRYKPEYQEAERFDLNISPIPDFSSYSDRVLNFYSGGIVQTSRGCPFHCEYCDAIVYLGHTMRYKPVEQVLREVEQMHDLGFELVLLADDNFSAGRNECKDILRALRDWNRLQKRQMLFAAQLSIDVAEDEELLELCAEAGLIHVLIGIESPDDMCLREVNKVQNIREDILEDIRKFHEHGIFIIGNTMVGFDHDDLSVFARHFDFFMRAGIVTPQPVPLHALDGTPLKERVRKEGRYIELPDGDDRMTAHLFNTFTFHPKQISVQQLQEGMFWLIRELYKPENVVKRLRVFLEHYESSPGREALVIPCNVPRPRDVGVFLRLLKYLVTGGASGELRAFWQMLWSARGSSHPHAISFAVGSFLLMKNVHRMLSSINSDIEHAGYPGGDKYVVEHASSCFMDDMMN